MQAPGGVDDDDVAAARLRRRDGVESDRRRVGAPLRADEVGAGALRPDLELLLGRRAVGVRRSEDDGASRLAQAVRELADRRRLAGAVDSDDEDDRRRAAEREPLLAVGRDELGDHLLEPGDELLLARRLARLEPLHDLDGRRDAAVGRDQRLLDPLPRLLVARDRRASSRVSACRLAAERLRAAGRTSRAALPLPRGRPPRVAEELGPGAAHALSGLGLGSPRRAASRRSAEMPSAPIVTP